MFKFLGGVVIFASLVVFGIFGWCLFDIIQLGWELGDFFSLLFSGIICGVLVWCGWYMVNHPPLPEAQQHVMPWSNIVVLALLSSAITAIAYNVKPTIRELNILANNQIVKQVSDNETQLGLSKEESKRARYRAKSGSLLPELRSSQTLTVETPRVNNQMVYESEIPPGYNMNVGGPGLRIIRDDIDANQFTPYDKTICWPKGKVGHVVPVKSHIWYVACTPK